MKAIIDEKLYNTETATKIFDFRCRVDKGLLFWNPKMNYLPFHEMELYVTAKGAYFRYDIEDKVIKPISKENAMNIVKQLDPDKFSELFNLVVEEA